MDESDFITVFVLIVALIGYILPTIVALFRGHAYKWVILALNVAGGWTGLIWVAALVWAFWPRDKSLIDPVLGNVTGTGIRNAGDVLGAIDYGRERGYNAEATANLSASGLIKLAALERLERLHRLHTDGVLSQTEFEQERSKII